jgi:bifunctional DNase/RNase
LDPVQVDILGLSTSPASGGAYALILKETEGERRLPIIIGAFEAQAIALEIEGIKPPRPMTHDLIKNLIDTLDIGVVKVTITELREGTFYARISLEHSVLEDLDARPSDAIAIAVRFGVPIFVSTDVLDEAGFTPEGDEEEVEGLTTAEPAIQTKEQKLEQLQNKLSEAVKKEDYEEAARVRDEIRRMKFGD